jgi:hypothetical protein
MQSLYKPNLYPAEIRKLIESESETGISRANTLMLGWEKRVKALIAAGQYEEAFKYQVEQDRQADLPQYNHLARHEVRELLGMTEACPMPS